MAEFSTLNVNEVFDQCANNVLNKPNNISIGWKNLQYEVNQFSGWTFKRKPIVQQLNGFFEHNSLNALMGPSGAGKSTLLSCFAGNMVQNGLTRDSEIYLDSNKKATNFIFIEQHVHESIVGRMTIGQIFRYAFKFKNGSTSNAIMKRHIDQVMSELMLPLELLDRLFQNCSGGEQKRVAIGQELMALERASFLAIDEPTTGLDSSAALHVVQCLKRLTENSPITIIASIHVPNNETLDLFNKLYILAKGGVCIYSGGPNQIQSFLEQNLQLTIAKEQPPIEALIKLACNGN